MFKEDLSALNLSSLSAQYTQIRDNSADNEILQAKIADLVSSFAEDNKLKSKSEWFLQQGVARFSELPLSRNSTGKISSRNLLNDFIREDPELLGLWLLFKYLTRSAVIGGQTLEENRNYCSLVPLIMSSFKKYWDIGYEEWDKSEISAIVEPKLAAAMNTTMIPHYSRDELLEIRRAALTPKSGRTAGVMQSPITAYRLFSDRIAELSMLNNIMLLQTWCANPVNRTKYMILDPLNWDNMPEPLVNDEVFVVSPKSKKTTNKPQILSNEIPWDM